MQNHIPASHFMEVVRVNHSNMKLTDKQFSEFMESTLQIVVRDDTPDFDKAYSIYNYHRLCQRKVITPTEFREITGRVYHEDDDNHLILS